MLVEVDETAELDGVRVVKLRVDEPRKASRRYYWIDLEHGAVPLRFLELEHDSYTGVDIAEQINYDDVRWVARGWLPFHQTVAWGNPTASGAMKTTAVRETVIEEADLEHRPDRALFRLELPEEWGTKGHNMIDVDRLRVHQPRQVWDLAAISPAATARARPMRIGGPSVAPPVMPGAREPRSWWPILLMIVGVILLLGSGAIVYRRTRRYV